MSTSAQISPAWKDEVNRRLAEHRSRDGAGRKGTSASEQQAPAESQRNSSRRAMEAAARVAARYANAPSYSDVLANEARAALRAAEAASRAALHAQAAAQSVLAGIEAANEPVAEPVDAWRMAPAPEPVADYFAPANDVAPLDDFFDVPVASHAKFGPESGLEPFQETSLEPFQETSLEADLELGPELVRSELPAAYTPIAAVVAEPVPLRWDLELPAHPEAPVETRAARGQEIFETGAERWWQPAAAELERAEPEQIEVVEPVSIPANLIEFPRELVAPRKARPRLVEGPSAAHEASVQLSIFEVDPISISTEPLAEEFNAPAQAWSAPTWSGMELDAQPQRLDIYEVIPEPAPQAAVATPVVAAAIPEAAIALQPAPATLRLMALVVDGALVAGSLLAGAMVAASRASVLPGMRTTEIGMALGFVAAAILYQTLFFTLGRATPGMKYAQIRLTTFEGGVPVRAERCKRMGALLVSVLPAGLGVAWSLFDENHLSWHDRLSRTYLCRR